MEIRDERKDPSPLRSPQTMNVVKRVRWVLFDVAITCSRKPWRSVWFLYLIGGKIFNFTVCVCLEESGFPHYEKCLLNAMSRDWAALFDVCLA